MGRFLTKVDPRIMAVIKRNDLVITHKGKHPHIRTKDGHYIAAVALTPSDRRGVANALSQLRAKGFE